MACEARTVCACSCVRACSAPADTLLYSCDEYEVREYEALPVASVDLSAMGMGGGGGFGGALAAPSLAAYNALAAYFLGANAMGSALDLTSPVRVDVGGGDGAQGKAAWRAPAQPVAACSAAARRRVGCRRGAAPRLNTSLECLKLNECGSRVSILR